MKITVCSPTTNADGIPYSDEYKKGSTKAAIQELWGNEIVSNWQDSDLNQET